MPHLIHSHGFELYRLFPWRPQERLAAGWIVTIDDELQAKQPGG